MHKPSVHDALASGPVARGWRRASTVGVAVTVAALSTGAVAQAAPRPSMAPHPARASHAIARHTTASRLAITTTAATLHVNGATGSDAGNMPAGDPSVQDDRLRPERGPVG